MDADKLREQEKKAKPGNGLDQKKYTFRVEIEFNGRTLTGAFTNKILSNNERAEVDLLAARMRGGLSYDSFSPDAQVRQQMIAHLIVSLDKDRPDWAKEIGEIEDINIIAQIYEEVRKHEDNFRKPRKDS